MNRLTLSDVRKRKEIKEKIVSLTIYTLILAAAGLLFYVAFPSQDALYEAEQNRLTTILISHERKMEVVVLHPRDKEGNARSREGSVPLLWTLEQIGFRRVNVVNYTGVVEGVPPRDLGKCAVQALGSVIKVECGRVDYSMCFTEKFVQTHVEALIEVEHFMECIRKSAPTRPKTTPGSFPLSRDT